MATTATATAPATEKQINLLVNRYHYSPEQLQGVSISEASILIDATIKAGHKLDAVSFTEFKEAEANEDRSDIEARGVLLPTITDTALDKLFEGMSAAEKDEEYEMRQELKSVNQEMQGAVERLGRVLNGYKETIARGLWLPFLKVLRISDRSAQRYMELANIKSQLGSGMVKALEHEGVKLGASGHDGEARQIAKTLNEMATKRLEQKANTTPGSYFDDCDPTLTEDEQTELVQRAIEKHRQPESDPVERIKNLDSELPLDQRIRMWENDLKETMKGLRAAYNDDTAFSEAVSRICKEVLNG
ncbi:MAG: hypothetical protein ABSD53_22725 [Terriglobales bacterium]|jgi:hypothetical protein